MNKLHKQVYEKYKDRPTSRLIKLRDNLVNEAKKNKWEIPIVAVVITDILKDRENEQ